MDRKQTRRLGDEVREADPADEISEAACGACGFHVAERVDANAIRRAGLAALARRKGARLPPWTCSPPRGPRMAQPTYFFLLYILIYPENIREHDETLFPPPQPSVPKRSHLGAFSGAPPERASITEGLLD